MKLLLENWRKFINEIGDASAELYPFEVIGQSTADDVRYVEYGFKTEEYLYRVNFYLTSYFGGEKRKPTWKIDFEASEKDRLSAFSTRMTGEGNPLRIMSTVVNIIKDFAGNPRLNDGILRFRFTGMPKSDAEDLYSDKATQRTRLYRAFLEKNMPPGTKVEEDGSNMISFTIPKEQKDETPA